MIDPREMREKTFDASAAQAPLQRGVLMVAGAAIIVLIALRVGFYRFVLP